MQHSLEAMRPAPYGDFTRQYINGVWQEGRSAECNVQDVNPYDGSELTRLRGASLADVDAAYRAAAQAQSAWAAQSPRQRAAVQRRAADSILERRQEIIEWTVRETGGVRSFAEIIWNFA